MKNHEIFLVHIIKVHDEVKHIKEGNVATKDAQFF